MNDSLVTLAVVAPIVTAPYSLSYSILDYGGKVAGQDNKTYQVADNWSNVTLGALPVGYTVADAGNTSVAFSHTVGIRSPATGPAPGNISSLHISYTVAAGYRYTIISPTNKIPITAQGNLTRISMWVYGNTVGGVGVRVIDSGNQVFQYSFGQINSPGAWKYAQSTSVGYFGGAADGVMRAPIYWMSPLAWDTGSVASSGDLYFTPPMGIFTNN